MSKPRNIAVVEPYFKSMGEHSYTRPDYATSFRVNYQWLKFGEQNKKLAINKFSVFPENHYFTSNARVNYNNKPYDAYSIVTAETGDNMHSILVKVFQDLNHQLLDAIKAADPYYNDDVFILKFYLENNTLSARSLFGGRIGFGANAQKLLNQEKTPDVVLIPLEYENEHGLIVVDEKIELFKNVWDRERLFLHASFSEANKHYVCEMNESFIFLNKEFVCDSHLFDIWFTDDGEHPFPLYHENYLFELAFMRGK